MHDAGTPNASSPTHEKVRVPPSAMPRRATSPHRPGPDGATDAAYRCRCSRRCRSEAIRGLRWVSSSMPKNAAWINDPS